MGLQLIIGCLLVTGLYFVGRYSKTSDTEVWNGQVIRKAMVRVSCRHSYSCNCVQVCSGTGSNRTCTEVCQTCYERVYLRGLPNEYINIDTTDRQGLREPPRWTKAQIGDPVAETFGYTNWVKAVPESLFHNDATLSDKYKDFIPKYPLKVYDYHYVDRVLPVGVKIPDLAQWNRDLAVELEILGPNRQANVNDPSYAYALKNAWLGGKKNDIIIVVGTATWPKIDWVNVFSWSKNDLVNVRLRDDLLKMGTMDRTKFMDVLRNDAYTYYVRRPMAEFEYLKDEIEPPLWVIIAGLILGVGCSIGFTVFFANNDIRSY